MSSAISNIIIGLSLEQTKGLIVYLGKGIHFEYDYYRHEMHHIVSYNGIKESISKLK